MPPVSFPSAFAYMDWEHEPPFSESANSPPHISWCFYKFYTSIFIHYWHFLSWPNTQFIRHNCKPMSSKEM